MKRFFPILILIAALSLATVAAYYSVFGISKLFSSQASAVILMAAILEASKLITASYLERFWETIHWLRKTYLITALIALMAITSLGIYGFLVSAYQETAYKMQAVDKQVEVKAKKRDRYQQQVKDISKEQKDMDEIYKLVSDEFKDFNHVSIIRDYSINLLNHLQTNSLDWVYIDGNHAYEYVIQDLEISFNLVKSQGFIFGDDYTGVHPGVMKAFDEFLEKYKDKVEKIKLKNCQIVIKKL